MDKILKLYTYVDGVSDTPFPQGAEEPLEIGAFRYDAKRMGGAPTITASVNYPSCLDNEWTDKVYAEFNGEKYYLKQTPTSSYNNESTMYKHDLELVSERVILDNVYFFDAVTGTPQGDDKPVSNSTKVMFFGNIREFVARLNASLQYSNVGYTVDVDDDVVTTEEKLMSFEDQFFSNVLQEIYKTYEVPYYFDGKVIRIGWAKSSDVIPTFRYGVNNALLSITKNNTNYKIVNRATGTGSSDNIPFYYPNNSPKGEIVATPSRGDMALTVVDMELYANEVAIDGELRYERFSLGLWDVTSEQGAYNSGDTLFLNKIYGSAKREFSIHIFADGAGVLPIDLDYAISNVRAPLNGSTLQNDTISCRFSVDIEETYISPRKDLIKSAPSGVVNIPIESSGDYIITIVMEFASKRSDTILTCNYSLLYDFDDGYTGWTYNGKEVDLKDVGLRVDNPISGDTITQNLVKYIKTSQKLLPSVYRETDGAERFYNATNGEYTDEDGSAIVFNNPYVEGRPKEHIITVEDIKPTIEGTEVNGLRIDMFSEFAYDNDDNDETYEDEEGNVYFKHPYFYGKLRVMDFNLFDHAIENQPMTISFTSGDCGACNFEIGVTEEYPQKNPVQVDENGNLRRQNGMVLAGIEGTGQVVTSFQERQQDTSKYEVWIALKKEEETYGILMPQSVHRPKAAGSGNDGDAFVILGINLPESYIINAEKKLEAEIIKYLKENNDEKFTFSINFSRIYFAEEENEDVLEQLSENSKIKVAYGVDENDLDDEGNPKEKIYDLYVSSFSYNMSEGDVLPEIRVELDDTLKVSQNALQNAISQVKSELGKVIGSIDVVGIATPYFIRKDADDEANGTVNFKKGIKFGEGGKVEILDNNSAKLTIEYLEVTKKASFTSLEIQEKTHVGGQILVTPAAITCGEVEELDDAYRCYFQTMGADGDEIFNQFAVGDQAICQTYNAWGSRYYWRLVTGIGEDYIDLSKVEGEYDEDSDAPSAGDKIVQLGNQVDKDRQNAIVLSAFGDESPSMIQYSGINKFELTEDNIVTKFSPYGNLITGKLRIEAGSTGFENLSGELNLGAQNLLRNSGFTGDYLSEPLADEEVMEAAKELFSDPLDHWKDDDTEDGVDMESWGAEVIELAGVSASGYGASLNDVTNEDGTTTSARLYQNLYYDLIGGETYVLSFKAKGNVIGEDVDEETGETIFVYNTIVCNVGDYTEVVTLTDEWAKYTIKATPSVSSKVFSIVGTGVTLCEIQLERGTMATSWGMSPLDNSSDRTYYQSMQYLANSMVKEVAEDGATEVLGGVILTNHIKVGDYSNQSTFVENGGVSGLFTQPDDPAFWAGGSFDKATTTAAKYETNTTTPENEIAYVVTHGGKVILNDAVVRGAIYANSGVFSGFVKHSETILDAANESKYISSSSWYRDYIDIQKLGGYVKVTSGLNYPIGLWGSRNLTTAEEVDEVRSTVGSRCVIVNKSGGEIRVTGDTKQSDEGNYFSLVMFNNTVAYCECKARCDADGYEEIYWLVTSVCNLK